MNNGKKLEMEFINVINNHKYSELNSNLKQFILFTFKNFNYDDKFICRKLDNYQKADISIKIGDSIKYVSIKSGSQNSIHVEKIQDFKTFLIDQEVKQQYIDNLLIYHFGDDTLTGNGKVRHSAEECKLKYKKEIIEFNKHINFSKVLPKIIERFLLKGTRNSNKYVDIIYYGDINIGVWCSNKEILKYCINHKSMYMNTPHFSVFTYQNWCRNITFSKKSESHRNYIQIKWFSILSDINKIRKQNDTN